MDKLVILSCKGGGLRGVSSLVILKKIEELLGANLHSKFNLIAGTSTGGLIASALGIGIKTTDILNLYLDRGDEIFKPLGKIGEKIRNASNVLTPKYSPCGVNKVLSDVLGNKRMSDLETEIMITSFDLNTYEPMFFKSKNKKERDFKLFDICRATSAAPTYLPSYVFDEFNCIDGGVFCNNPTLAAVADVLKNHTEYGLNNVEIDRKNIFVLSVGTGIYKQKIDKKDSQTKGQLYWAHKAPDLMMSAVNVTTDYMMKQIIPESNYLNLDITIEDEVYSKMDDSSTETLNYLMAATKKQITENPEKLNQIKRFIAAI